MPRERRLNLPLQPVPATEVAAVVDEVASRLDELEDKLTAVLTRILERAGRTATASFRRHVTDHLTAAALREADRAALQRIRMGDLGNGLFGYRLRPEVLTAAAPSQTSAMICVKPRPVEAEAIADPDGEPPDDLHVTLVYLGDVEDSALQALVDAVRPVAASHAPLTGTVGGYGRFEPAGVGILLPDVPGLVELRVAVTEALVDADLDYARNHGFEAHITIDADPEADEADLMLTRSGQPLHFDALLLVRGDAIVAELPLVGRPPLTAAGPPDTTPFEKRVDRAQQALRDALGTGNENAIREAKDEVRSAQDALYKAVATPQWTAPGADELLNVDALMKALRTKTNPVRQALIENILGTTRKLVDPIETNYRWELIPSDEVSSDTLLEDVLGWPGDAEDVAGAAITEAESGTGNLYVLRDRSTSRIVAVANVEEGRDALIVHNIASLGGGTGTTLLQTIARNAGIDNLGVRLRATPAAANYYRGLPGFEEGQNLDFHLPADKAPGFAAGTVGGGTSRAAQMFDVTNPLVAKALATTGEHITSIGDTTRANVMKVIDASWQQGLSIPNTAKAIQAAMADAAPIRARMIARTELVGAINGGSLAATQLVAGATGTPYLKRWQTAPGAPNPRHELYEGLDGQTVGLDEAFDVGGDALQYPGDPDGAPEEVINCFPGSTLVVADDARVGFRRRYRGSLIRVESDGEHSLAGTPNHPVLTRTGWKRLADVREGDYLVCGRLREVEVAVGARPDVDHAPATIQEVVGALARAAAPSRIVGHPMQFHGDGSDGEVEVVAANRLLRLGREATNGEPVREDPLVRTREVGSRLAPSRAPGEIGLVPNTSADSSVGCGGDTRTLRERRSSHPFGHRGTSPAALHSEFAEAQSDHVPADVIGLGKRLLGDAFEVSLAKVVKVEEQAFHGDVFNLETGSGVYLASGVIAHNCRCTMTYVDGSPSAANVRQSIDAPTMWGEEGDPRLADL